MKHLMIFSIYLVFGVNIFAQNQAPKPLNVATEVKVTKHISSSILLWMLNVKPRQEYMDYWRGPHSKIITAKKGLSQYRQLHLAESNTGLWPVTVGIETSIPADRKIDGVADVTFKNIFSLLRGKKQTRMAFADEINLFHRTLLYLSNTNEAKWYEVAKPDEIVKARTIVYLRRKEGVSANDFRNFINKELGPTLANMNKLKELRSQTYKPWSVKLWNSPNVLHDNAPEVQFQASLIFGFSNKNEMDAFFKDEQVKQLSIRMSDFCSAIHAYDIANTIVFINDGKKIN